MFRHQSVLTSSNAVHVLGNKVIKSYIISVRFHRSKPTVQEFPLLHGSGEKISNIVRILAFKNAYSCTGCKEFSFFNAQTV